MSPVILLTDFGEKDGFSGVMRLVLQRLYPQLPVVDLSHGVEPYQVLSAAWVLASAVPYAPQGSVFCVVVDPGVGSDRAVLVAQWPHFTVVAPNNGLISLCVRLFGEPRTVLLSHEKVSLQLGLPPASHTFQGRDLFAPLAGAVASGLTLSFENNPAPFLLPVAKPRFPQGSGVYPLHVLHVDHFGNLVLDCHRQEWPATIPLVGARIQGPGVECQGLQRTFSDVPPGEFVFYWGSSGWLELALNQGHAHHQLGGSTEPIFLVLP